MSVISDLFSSSSDDELSFLEEINLSFNALSGSLPDYWGSKWKGLKVFRLRENSLEGTLPPSYGNWTSLTFFGVGGNKKITGDWCRVIMYFNIFEYSIT